MHTMKIISILLTIIAVSLSLGKFKLTMYQQADCNYCKFAENQIKTIIK